MKQIFDWLREQINSAPIVKLLGTEYIGIRRVKQIINKAEAKWEADCCEWKVKRFATFDDVMDFVCEPHFGNYYQRSKGEWNYCQVCGKPIKISEVE